MKRIIFSLYLIPLAGLLACAHVGSTKPSSRSSVLMDQPNSGNDIGDLEDGYDCGSAQYRPLSIINSVALPSPKDFPLAPLSVKTPFDMSDQWAMRIDSCLHKDGTLDFKRAVIKSKTNSSTLERNYFQILPGPNSKIIGLTEAVLKGDTSKLSMILPYQDPQDKSKIEKNLYVATFKHQSKDLVYYYGATQDDSKKPGVLNFYAGEANPVNPFPQKPWRVKIKGDIPSIACKSGQYTPLTLVQAAGLPKLGDFTPAPFKVSAAGEVIDDFAKPNLRLDTCVTPDGKVALQRVIEKKQDEFFALTPGPDSLVEGLAETINDGDPSKLLITLPYTAEFSFGRQSLMIKGKVFNDETLAFFYETMNSIRTTEKDREVFVGALELSDPFQFDPDCRGEKRRVTEVRDFALGKGNVKLTLVGCGWFEFGTHHFDLLEATVMDTGAPSEFANKSYTLKASALPEGSALRFTTVHHNACTSFAMRLPHALYAYTSKLVPGNTGAQASSCPSLVEEAPTIEDAAGIKRTDMRVFYTGGEDVTYKGVE
ncbi:MAG: hypothetical protein EOP04_00155 [Proteobacteria bacterium]|nr:MAG: hypothetical protein EOP04_00155 [Pseudomonadota bacterium]